MLADDHQEFLHLLQRLIGYILHGGKVGINDDSDGLTQPGRKILQGFTVEGVVAVGKVRFEERSHFDASDDFHRFFYVVRQDIIQRNRVGLEDAFQIKIFAE